MGLIVTLSLPHKALSPNSTAHWKTKAAKRKAYRLESGWAGKIAYHATCSRLWAEDPRPMERAKVTPFFYWPDKRKRDEDNASASLKAAFDGLQDAGIIQDDSGLSPQPPVFAVDRQFPRVELHIEEIAEAKP